MYYLKYQRGDIIQVNIFHPFLYVSTNIFKVLLFPTKTFQCVQANSICSFTFFVVLSMQFWGFILFKFHEILTKVYGKMKVFNDILQSGSPRLAASTIPTSNPDETQKWLILKH